MKNDYAGICFGCQRRVAKLAGEVSRDRYGFKLRCNPCYDKYLEAMDARVTAMFGPSAIDSRAAVTP